MTIRFARAFAPAFLLALLAGCGDGLAPATISGEVRIDGKPMRDGTIAFSSADGKGAPASTEIKDGKYSVATTAGPKVVQISSMVVTGKHKDGGAMIDLREENVPAQYNAATELKFDAKPGENKKEWEVKGLGKGPK